MIRAASAAFAYRRSSPSSSTRCCCASMNSLSSAIAASTCSTMMRVACGSSSAVTVCDRVEVVAGVVGGRGGGMEDAHVEPRRPRGGTIFTRGDAAGVLQHRARRDEVELLPAIDMTVEGDTRGIGGWRGRIAHQPLEAQAGCRRAQRILRGHVHVRIRAADRGAVYVGEMGRIEQVVGDELEVASHRSHQLSAGPAWVAMERVVDDQRFVGRRHIADPDPQHLVLLDQRETRDARLGWNDILIRNPRADTGGRKDDAMVVAADALLDDRAEAQRRAPMGAAVDQRRGATRQSAEQYDRPVADPARQRLRADFARPGRQVPRVLDDH